MTVGSLWLMWTLLACSSTPPELVAQAAALEKFRAAESAMEGGRDADALAALDEALALRPSDVLLRAWRAHVLARTDLDAAIAELDRVAAAHPRFAEARYNRAAYLARAGRIEEAGAEVRVALELGAATIAEARRDTDFAPHLAHPAMAPLQLPIALTVERLPDKVFRGSELMVNARLEHAGTFTLSAPVRGPALVVRAVEDERDVTRAFEWTLDTVAPGTIEVGPFDVRAEERPPVQQPAQRVEVVGPQREAAPGVADVSLAAPSTWAGALELHHPVRMGGRVVVKVAPTERVEVTPPALPLQRAELRRDGQPRWVAWSYPASVTEVVVRGAGGERFRGPPERSDAGDPAPR